MNPHESSRRLCQELARAYAYKPKSRWWGKDPALPLLESAARSGDPAVMAAVCPFVFSDQEERRDRALKAIDELWILSNDKLPRFDAWFRGECGSWFHPAMVAGGSEWFHLSSKKLDQLLLAFGERAHRALLLCTCHPSGYVRERVLKVCEDMEFEHVLPFCLIRLNDWVPSVRQVAGDRVRHWLETAESPNILPLLPLFYRLEECHRADHRGVLNAMAKHLQEGVNREQIIEGMRDSSPVVRGICYGIVMHKDAAESLRREAILLGLSDPLAHLRMRASNQAKAFGLEFADTMLEDRFMPIRRNGLELHVESRSEKHRSLLEEALDDPHRSIREFAHYWLKTLGYATAVADHYRTQLNHESVRDYIALLGLGETGDAGDCPRIAEFLGHDSPKFREAAVRGLSNLNFKENRDKILECVADRSARVSRVATNNILGSPGSIRIDHLQPLLMDGTHRHTCRHALRLVRKTSKWERIEVLLRLVAEGDETTSRQATDASTQWFYGFNNSFAQPSSQRLIAVRSALDSAEKRLPEWLRNQLSALLESVSPRT